MMLHYQTARVPETRAQSVARAASMRRARQRCLRCISLVSLLCSSAAACASASFRDDVYSGPHARYRVGALSAAWKPFHVSGNDLAFHRAGLGTISVNATCENYEDVPLDALLNHLLFETSERKFLLSELVTLDGRGARHVVVQAELDGVPLEFELFLLKKDGCVIDLAHIRNPGSGAAGRPDFIDFVQHFALLTVNR